MRRQFECEFEAEVLAEVVQLRWPNNARADLREHAANCSMCSEAVAIAAAFDDVRESAVALPDSGRVWWLAQIRARREAADTAAKPILATQIIAFAWAMGLLAVYLLPLNFKAIASSAGALFVQHGGLVIGTATFLLALSAAAYWVLSRE
jgi:hypothetical protein